MIFKFQPFWYCFISGINFLPKDQAPPFWASVTKNIEGTNSVVLPEMGEWVMKKMREVFHNWSIYIQKPPLLIYLSWRGMFGYKAENWGNYNHIKTLQKNKTNFCFLARSRGSWIIRGNGIMGQMHVAPTVRQLNLVGTLWKRKRSMATLKWDFYIHYCLWAENIETNFYVFEGI